MKSSEVHVFDESRSQLPNTVDRKHVKAILDNRLRATYITKSLNVFDTLLIVLHVPKVDPK